MRLELKEMVTRLEWMSRTILLAEATLPSLSFCDIWTHSRVDNEVNNVSLIFSIFIICTLYLGQIKGGGRRIFCSDIHESKGLIKVDGCEMRSAHKRIRQWRRVNGA